VNVINTDNLTWVDHCNAVDWDDLSHLYVIAPLGEKDPKDLKTVFSNSRYTYFVYDENKLIGVGRALADGVDCSYICDVAVHPEYQGLGLGKVMVQRLLEDSKGHSKILLYSVPGKEEFYTKFGFSKMKTAMAIFKRQDWAKDISLVE